MSESASAWQSAYIGLGSNLDGPVKQVEVAFELLEDIPHTRLVARSSLYRSSPLGGIEQPDFVNSVVALQTQLEPLGLLAELQAIERKRGRERGGPRWGPRVLDLDLLLYSEQIIDTDDLQVPHPGIAERNFVLLPLRELAPDLLIPGLGHVGKISVNEHEPRIMRIA